MTLPISTGIEMELWVTDREGCLTDGRVLTDAHSRIEEEFVPCLLEVKTEPHETETGLREDLGSVLGTAIETAKEHGRRLVALGTPLTTAQMEATSTRGQLFEDIYGEGIVAARNCAGSHIHFEKGNVRRQLNLLTALDPALALVSSSPYYRGTRHQHCSRALAYRSKCGQDFHQFCQLLEYVESVDAWEARNERLYHNFCDIAREKGVSGATVSDNFSVDDTVLNPVRLQQTQPTVEWRAPDSTLPSQIVSLAVDLGSLVASTESTPLEYGSSGVTDERIGVPKFETLRQLSRQAIRFGPNASGVSEYLDAMGFDVQKYAPVAPSIDGPTVISNNAACGIRLDQADRLERDLETLTERTATDTLAYPNKSPRDVPTRPSLVHQT